MLLNTIENYKKLYIESIEPINHTLVVLLMKAKNLYKQVILLARIHPQELSAQDESRPRKKAKRGDEFANRWSYTVLDFHITACSNAQCYYHILATRDTLDSIVHETCTNLKFYGVSNDKLVFQHEILKDNVVLQDERADEEQDDDDEDYNNEHFSYRYEGKFCIMAVNCCCGIFLSKQKRCIQIFFTI